MKWNKLATRPMDEEERELYGKLVTYIWDGPTPEIGEQVLIYQKGWNYVYLDEWVEFDEGVGFDSTDVDDGDVIYWTSIPRIEDDEQELI